MQELLSKPWPWYIGGPLIGLMVPALLIAGNRAFGISSSLQHICAACIPTKLPFFKYEWKKDAWSIFFATGIIAGGWFGGNIFGNPHPVAISPATTSYLTSIGIINLNGLDPIQIFSFHSLLTVRGFIFIVVGGFLVGFGTRYAGGCTSGHSIMGLSNLQWPSLVATICFFIGGLCMSWFILPYLMQL